MEFSQPKSHVRGREGNAWKVEDKRASSVSLRSKSTSVKASLSSFWSRPINILPATVEKAELILPPRCRPALIHSCPSASSNHSPAQEPASLSFLFFFFTLAAFAFKAVKAKAGGSDFLLLPLKCSVVQSQMRRQGQIKAAKRDLHCLASSPPKPQKRCHNLRCSGTIFWPPFSLQSWWMLHRHTCLHHLCEDFHTMHKLTPNLKPIIYCTYVVRTSPHTHTQLSFLCNWNQSWFTSKLLKSIVWMQNCN